MSDTNRNSAISWVLAFAFAALAGRVASILQAERAGIASGHIAAIGRRIVAQNQPLKNSRITPAS